MRKALRQALVLAGLVLVLALVNADIRSRQRILDDGRLVLLALRPVDPRSLIQGDYMELALAAETLPPDAAWNDLPTQGIAVLAVDARGIARFRRLDDGRPLGAEEIRLAFTMKPRPPGQWPSYGADSFFFQEGLAELYGAARFAALRVDPAGRGIVTGLADEAGQIIGTEARGIALAR